MVTWMVLTNHTSYVRVEGETLEDSEPTETMLIPVNRGSMIDVDFSGELLVIRKLTTLVDEAAAYASKINVARLEGKWKEWLADWKAGEK